MIIETLCNLFLLTVLKVDTNTWNNNNLFLCIGSALKVIQINSVLFFYILMIPSGLLFLVHQ